MQPYAVKITSAPTYTSLATGQATLVDSVQIGDVGVVIAEPDAEGDVEVIFDYRVEVIDPTCLSEHNDPTRVGMWVTSMRHNLDDRYDAQEDYWTGIQSLLARGRNATKVCARCAAERPLRDFGFHEKERDGYRAVCKPCVKASR